jgi:hypothetical protein
MAPSTQNVGEDIVARIKVALAAWSDLDVSGLSEHFSDHVVFGSPSTEWVGDRGWTQGKSEVLRRFARERSNFTELELVEILVASGRATVLLKDGCRLMTCLVELDADGRFSRLVSFFAAPPGEKIAWLERPDHVADKDEIL